MDEKDLRAAPARRIDSEQLANRRDPRYGFDQLRNRLATIEINFLDHERLQRIEAAARELLVASANDGDDFIKSSYEIAREALRAALEKP